MITLIRPPSIQNRFNFSSGGSIPPIGVALLASYLKSKNYSCVVVDALGEGIFQKQKIPSKDAIVTGLTHEQILSRILPESDIIGVSCMFSSEWYYIEDLIRTIKRAYPRATIVVGGEHITGDWKNTLDLCPAVDFCVLGEGEETFCELIDFIRKTKEISVESIPGIAFRSAAGAVKNPSRKRIKKLNEMPWPDWSLFPIQNYLDNGHSQVSINRKTLPILASRGCPFRCTFCTSPNMWGNELFLRDVDDIIEEVKFLHGKYQNEHFDFIDIVGALNPNWTKQLLTKLADLDLPVTWMYASGTRSEILTPEILDLFKKSKVLRIFYSPETGSKSTIKKIKKRVDLEKMVRAMKYTNKLGISMRAPLIFGFPGQSMREVLESLVFGLKLVWLGVDDIVIHSFSSHPGSELYNQLVKEHKIDIPKLIERGEYFDFLTGIAIGKVQGHRSWSEEIPSSWLPFLQLGPMLLYYSLQFLIRPARLFNTLKRVLYQRKPLTLFDHVLYSMVFESKFKIKYKLMPVLPFKEAIQE